MRDVRGPVPLGEVLGKTGDNDGASGRGQEAEHGPASPREEEEGRRARHQGPEDEDAPGGRDVAGRLPEPVGTQRIGNIARSPEEPKKIAVDGRTCPARDGRRQRHEAADGQSGPWARARRCSTTDRAARILTHSEALSGAPLRTL